MCSPTLTRPTTILSVGVTQGETRVCFLMEIQGLRIQMIVREGIVFLTF
jgi:hypothetical protein